MYTRISPFKNEDGYWAMIDSTKHGLQRTLAFGSIENLSSFLKEGVFEGVDFKPYSLVALREDDQLFAGENRRIFDFINRSGRPARSADYPDWLLENIAGGKPLSGLEFEQCKFYMGFENAQAVASRLEAKVHQNLSDEERDSIITSLGMMPINGYKEPHENLPDIALYLVNHYLGGRAASNSLYKAIHDYVVDSPLANRLAIEMLKNRINPENDTAQAKAVRPLTTLIFDSLNARLQTVMERSRHRSSQIHAEPQRM